MPRPDDFRNFEVIRSITEKGKAALIVEGYRYRQKKKCKNGEVLWSCTSNTCLASMKTSGKTDVITSMSKSHNHKNDLGKAKRSLLVAMAKMQLKSNASITPAEVVDSVLEECSNKSISLLSNITPQDIEHLKNHFYNRHRNERRRFRRSVSSEEINEKISPAESKRRWSAKKRDLDVKSTKQRKTPAERMKEYRARKKQKNMQLRSQKKIETPNASSTEGFSDGFSEMESLGEDSQNLEDASSSPKEEKCSSRLNPDNEVARSTVKTEPKDPSIGKESVILSLPKLEKNEEIIDKLSCSDEEISIKKEPLTDDSPNFGMKSETNLKSPLVEGKESFIIKLPKLNNVEESVECIDKRSCADDEISINKAPLNDDSSNFGNKLETKFKSSLVVENSNTSCEWSLDNQEDKDINFFKTILSDFRKLNPSDKSMIKGQIKQLIAWKLKNVV